MRERPTVISRGMAMPGRAVRQHRLGGGGWREFDGPRADSNKVVALWHWAEDSSLIRTAIQLNDPPYFTLPEVSQSLIFDPCPYRAGLRLNSPRGIVASTGFYCSLLGLPLDHDSVNSMTSKSTRRGEDPLLARCDNAAVAASPFLRTSVAMLQRDSCASALAPRLSPKARGLHALENSGWDSLPAVCIAAPGTRLACGYRLAD
jgi:hypothetical protein